MLRSSRFQLFFSAALAISIVLALGLNYLGKEPPAKTLRTPRDDLVDINLLKANQNIQNYYDTQTDQPTTNTDVHIFCRLNRLLAEPESRSAAEKKLFQLWEKDPDNFLWIDLAITKYRYLSQKNSVTRLLGIATGNDSSAVADFVYWRQFVAKKAEAPDRLLQAEMKRAELTPLQQIWLQYRLTLSEQLAGKYDEAAEHLLATMPQALEFGGLPLITFWWHDLSTIYLQTGKLDNALYSSSRALQYARLGQDIAQEVRARLTMGLIHESRGEYSVSLDTITSCYSTASDSNLSRSKRAAIVQMSIVARAQGNTISELDLMRRGFSLAQSAADTFFSIRAASAIGNTYRRLGVLDSVAIWLNQASSLNSAWVGGEDYSTIDEAWILYFLQMGNYTKADSMFALATEGMLPEQQLDMQISLVIHLIKQGLETGNAEVAYQGLQRAQTMNLQNIASNSNYSAGLELALASALFLAHQGEFQQSQQQMSRARELLKTTGSPENQWNFSQYNGEISSMAGDYETAAQFFSKGWEMAKKIKDPNLQNRSMVGLGESYLHQRHFGKAHDLFLEASNSPEYWPRLNASMYLGITAAEQGNHQRALEYYSATDSLLGPTPPADLKIRLTLKKSISQKALGHPHLAYALLSEVPANSPTNNRNENLRAFNLDQNRDRAEALIELIFDCPEVVEGSSAALSALIEAEAARWRPDQGFTLPNASQLEQLVQNHSGPMLAYFVGKKRSFCWQGTEAGWTMRDLGSTEHLQSLVNNVVTDLEYPGRAIDTDLNNKLSKLLLDEIIVHWPSDQVLSLITDGFLTNVPFAALVDDHGPLVHMTSLSVRVKPQPKKLTDHSAALLVLGIDGNSRQDSDQILRFAETEARSIAAMWPEQEVVLLLGDNAKWDAVLDEDLSHFSAIHIATHAKIVQGLPGSSTLRFAEGENSTQVSISDVRNLNLETDLVFLSCCETGRLNSDTGSGLNSFARAFLQAGSSSVLAPVIRVEDEASQHLAQRFYYHWLQGKSRAASLKAAQSDTRNARESWAHPYYWAFFKLFEQPDY